MSKKRKAIGIIATVAAVLVTVAVVVFISSVAYVLWEVDLQYKFGTLNPSHLQELLAKESYLLVESDMLGIEGDWEDFYASQPLCEAMDIAHWTMKWRGSYEYADADTAITVGGITIYENDTAHGVLASGLADASYKLPHGTYQKVLVCLKAQEPVKR